MPRRATEPRKIWTTIVLDPDERAYIEARAAATHVSLAQIVRWCVRLAMGQDTTTSDTTDREDAA